MSFSDSSSPEKEHTSSTDSSGTLSESTNMRFGQESNSKSNLIKKNSELKKQKKEDKEMASEKETSDESKSSSESKPKSDQEEKNPIAENNESNLKMIQPAERNEFIQKSKLYRKERKYHLSKDDKIRSIKCCSTSITDCSKFGIGVSVYFETIQLFIILFTFFLFFCVVVTYLNYNNGKRDCTDSECKFENKTVWTKSSIGNQNGIDTQSILIGFCFLIVLIWYTLIEQRLKDKISQYYFQRSTFETRDYAVFVENLPTDVEKRALNEFFSHFGEVYEIQMSMNFGELIKKKKRMLLLENKIVQLRAQYRKWYLYLLRYLPFSIRKKINYFNSIEEISPLVKEVKEEMEELKHNKLKSTGKCIIIFKEVTSASKCLNYYNIYPFIRVLRTILFFIKWKNIKFGNKKIKVKRAPHPDDILWENLEISKLSRYFRILIKTILIIVFLFGGLILILLLESQKASLKSSNSDTSTFIIGIGISFIIIIINSFLRVTGQKLASFTKTQTKSQQNAGFVVELLTSLLLNSTIYIFFIYSPLGICFGDFALSKNIGDCKNQPSFFDNIGWIIVLIPFSNCFIAPTIETILTTCLGVYQKHRAKKNALTQFSLYKGFDLPEFPLGLRYLRIFLIIFLCLSLFSAFPYVILICWLGLIYIYYLDRWSVVTIYRASHFWDDTISLKMMSAFPWFLGLMLFYNKFWWSTHNNDYSAPNFFNPSDIGYILIIIWIVFIFWKFGLKQSLKLFSRSSKARKKDNRISQPFNDSFAQYTLPIHDIISDLTFEKNGQEWEDLENKFDTNTQNSEMSQWEEDKEQIQLKSEDWINSNEEDEHKKKSDLSDSDWEEDKDQKKNNNSSTSSSDIELIN
ncbi:putative transmembrane protein [Anaeramoeba flamelloides]|uniref:Transmembrane protein n=1 Tax=Anaeramoeba flamelloides TaxID=1746091 RepID=A0AAV8ABR5_9EUKA|nr:putative transmembrane protein [Anaeramoeba flamelloides]